MAGVSKLGLFRIRRSSSGHGPLRGRPLPSPRRPPGCATCGAAGRGAPHRWCAWCPPCTGRSCRAPAPASARLARPPRARPWPARATCPPPAPCAAARTAGLAHGGWPRAARAGRARPCASGPPAAAWRLYSCRSAARITRGEQSRHAMTDVQTVQCSSGAICHRHASVLCLVAQPTRWFAAKHPRASHSQRARTDTSEDLARACGSQGLGGPLACARTQGGACEGSSVAHVDVPGLKVTAFSVRSGGCAHS